MGDMKSLALLMALLAAGPGNGAGRAGHVVDGGRAGHLADDYETARATGQERGVPILVDVWAPW